MAFAGIQIEFYEGPAWQSTYGFNANAYGRLISSVNDTSVSGTENQSIPGGTALIRVYAAAESFVEIGEGNQDVGTTRKSVIPAQVPVDFFVSPGEDTISYSTA